MKKTRVKKAGSIDMINREKKSILYSQITFKYFKKTPVFLRQMASNEADEQRKEQQMRQPSPVASKGTKPITTQSRLFFKMTKLGFHGVSIFKKIYI